MSGSPAVVVVMHNSERWLPEFVRTWGDAAYAGNIMARMVFVDSGSTDRSPEVARELCPEATLIRCENIGFGAAANRGIHSVPNDWVLLCNPDLTFNADFGTKLFAAMKMPQACIAPGLLNPDGSMQPSVGRFPTVGGIFRDQFRSRARRKYVHPQPTEDSTVEWATGACLLLRRDVFLAVGGFDELYFLYMEEVDLQRRLRDAGHRTRYLPEMKVTHHQPDALRVPRPEVKRYAARGVLRYFAKFGGGLMRFRMLAAMSGRLALGEAFSSKKRILERPTGP